MHIGNALLVVKHYGEGPGATDEDEMTRQVGALQSQTQPLRGELECTFADRTAGC